MSDQENILPISDIRYAIPEVVPQIDEPRYPILDVRELGDELVDLRSKLSFENQALLQLHERVVHIHKRELMSLQEPLTAEYVITKAARAPYPSAVGKNGPIMASINPLEGTERSRYEDEFGRDSLQAALDTADVFPDLLETTLMSLAESQGVDDEEYIAGRPYRQEKLGSIILIKRNDPDGAMAKKFEKYKGEGDPYYGSVDAPASFINGLAIAQDRDSNFLTGRLYTDRNGVEHSMMMAFERSVEWLLEKTEENPEGLIEYYNPIAGGGIMNQGWRDSAGALVHADGSWANPESGIASVEVQGIAYDAFRNGARIYRALLDDHEMADLLDTKANNLQKQLIEKFWVDDELGGYMASGTDRDHEGKLRQLRTKTSAMGRLLKSSILKGSDPLLEKMVQQIIRALFAPDMLTPWGMRTLSSSERAYRPTGYHTGSIWKFDTDEVAAGLANHGYYGLDRELGARTTRQVETTGLFLEFISGDSSDEPCIPDQDVYVWNLKYNELYLFEQMPPVAQTWSATTEIAKKQRYNIIPARATDPAKSIFEDKIFSRLPAIV